MRNAPIFRVEFVEFNLEFNVSSIVTRFDILNDFIYANIIHNFKEVWVTRNLTPQFLLEFFEFGDSISLLDLLLNFVISDAWNQRAKRGMVCTALFLTFVSQSILVLFNNFDDVLELTCLSKNRIHAVTRCVENIPTQKCFFTYTGI